MVSIPQHSHSYLAISSIFSVYNIRIVTTVSRIPINPTGRFTQQQQRMIRQQGAGMLLSIHSGVDCRYLCSQCSHAQCWLFSAVIGRPESSCAPIGRGPPPMSPRVTLPLGPHPHCHTVTLCPDTCITGHNTATALPL